MMAAASGRLRAEALPVARTAADGSSCRRERTLGRAACSVRKSDIAALGKRAPKGPVLGLKTVDLEMKDVLLTSNPKVFFTTPHFDGYPAVLVELERISVKALKEALVEAWFACAGKRLASEYLTRSRRPPSRGRTRA